MRWLIVSLTLYLIPNILLAQDITGTWEGIMNDEYIVFNIRQENEKLCGFTRDFVINNRASRCTALFEGNYNKMTHTWTLNGF